MPARTTSWLSGPGLIRVFLGQLRLAFRLIREPRVPWLAKALPALAVLYVLSPLDFIPDVLPLIGQLDDLGIVVIAVELFIRFSPAPAVEFHRTAIAAGRRYAPMTAADDFIDAQWRHG